MADDDDIIITQSVKERMTKPVVGKVSAVHMILMAFAAGLAGGWWFF